jgi:hypothetical protein
MWEKNNLILKVNIKNSRERRQKIVHLILQDHKQIGEEMLPL